MYYTSEGESVKRYDVCNDTELSDFVSGLPGELYALRLLPTGGLLVAATEKFCGWMRMAILLRLII